MMAAFLLRDSCRRRLQSLNCLQGGLFALHGKAFDLRSFSDDAVKKNKTANVTLPESPGKEEPPQHAASTGASQSWSVSGHGLSEDQKDFLQVAQVSISKAISTHALQKVLES